MTVHKSPAAVRFARQFTIAWGLYIASLGFVFYLLRTHVPGRPAAIALAVLPAAAIIATILVFGKFVRDLEDEFQRTVLQQASLGAIGCTLAVTSISGSLEMFTHVPHLPMFLIFPIFWFFFGVCAAIVRLNYSGNAAHD